MQLPSQYEEKEKRSKAKNYWYPGVRREISNIKLSWKKVTTKLISNLQLNISKTTFWRRLHRFGHKCRKAAPQTLLTKKHKDVRVEVITQWLTECRKWMETVFSDEKRFSLDGPDSLC